MTGTAMTKEAGGRFVLHTLDSAPVASRPALTRVMQSVGTVPNLEATMAGSGALIEGFVTLREIVQRKSAFSDAERELILLTYATVNESRNCQSAHSMLGSEVGLSAATIRAVRRGMPLTTSRENALVAFAGSLANYRGRIRTAELRTFLEEGFQRQHVLDLVACLAQSVMANYTSHVAKVTADDCLG